MKQRTIVLRDGRILVVRSMTDADTPLVAEAFARLSAASLRRRFFSEAAAHFSVERLAELVGLHPGEHVLLAHDRHDRLVGGVRLIPVLGSPGLAEVTVTVADGAQGRGVGTRLLDLLAEDAASLGYHALRGHVLVENDRARRLVGRAGGHLWFDEPGVLAFEIPLTPDSQLLDEAIARSLQTAS